MLSPIKLSLLFLILLSIENHSQILSIEGPNVVEENAYRNLYLYNDKIIINHRMQICSNFIIEPLESLRENIDINSKYFYLENNNILIISSSNVALLENKTFKLNKIIVSITNEKGILGYVYSDILFYSYLDKNDIYMFSLTQNSIINVLNTGEGRLVNYIASDKYLLLYKHFVTPGNYTKKGRGRKTPNPVVEIYDIEDNKLIESHSELVNKCDIRPKNYFGFEGDEFFFLENYLVSANGRTKYRSSIFKYNIANKKIEKIILVDNDAKKYGKGVDINEIIIDSILYNKHLIILYRLERNKYNILAYDLSFFK